MIRFIPRSEITGSGLPDDITDLVLARYPTSRPGFLPGDVELTYDASEDLLEGSYDTHRAIWDASTRTLDEVVEVEHELVMTRELAIPFSPADARRRYGAYEQALTELLAYVDSFADERVPIFPPGYREAAEYRRGLTRRYLRIDGIYQAGTPVEFPGIPRPGASPVRPMELADLYTVSVAYGKLMLEEDVPSQTGAFAADLHWADSDGTIYFATDHEDTQVALALTYASIDAQRRRLRNYLTALLEGGVLGPTSFLPGGTLAQDVYTLTTGRNLYGRPASVPERIFAVADIALQTAPITVGALRYAARSNRAVHPLMEELRNTNQLLRRLEGAAGTGNRFNVATTREMIMTQWLDDYNRVMGFEGRALPTRAQAFTRAEGRPLAVSGIDDYVTPMTRNAGDIAIVREYKRAAGFDGNWSSASRIGLSNNQVRIPGLHAANTPARQASWSWFVDRGIKAHRYAVRNNLPELTRHSRELLTRFANDRLVRQVIVMSDDGVLHVSREAGLARLVDEAANPRTGSPVTLDELRRAVSDYLSEN